MRSAKLLITDLDNTLFDWVEVWYQSFSAMLNEIIEISKVPRETLVSEIRAVHQKHGTAEYAFLIEEIPSIRKNLNRDEILKIYEPAIHAYRKKRKESLIVYPNVIETLESIRACGTPIVAYTESMAFYTTYRLKRLNLDKLIDFLYSPEDHDLPENLAPEQVRMYPSKEYNLEHTIHKYTPKNAKKPNKIILSKILNEIGCAPVDAVYIGDSLMKDIAMAQDVGVIDVHAEYGKAQNRQEYNLLREVTHWTDAEVEKERHTLVHHNKPTIVLKNDFSEILNYINFIS